MAAHDRAPRPWFESDDHALKTGFLAGYLIRQGIQFNFVKDDAGNYKPIIEIVIPEEGEIEPVRIMIQVLGYNGEMFHNDE